MADYTDFLDAPDDGRHDAFLNAEPVAPTRNEGKGHKFRQMGSSDMGDSWVAKMFGKYTPDVVNFMGGVSSTMRGALNMVSPGEQSLSGLVTGQKTAPLGERVFPSRLVDKDAGMYMLGQVADPAAAAIGYGAGKAVQAIPAVTGAYRAAQASRALPLTAEMVARSGAVGGLTGATTGYLGSEGDLEAAGMGGLYGTGFGGAAPFIGKGVQKVGGWTVDALKGRTVQVKAAEIARAAAGGKLDEIKAAMRNAPSELTAGQAAYGIDRDMWQALQKIVEKGDSTDYYRLLSERQAANRLGRIAAVTPDKAAAEAARDAAMSQNMAKVSQQSQVMRTAREANAMPPAPVTVTQPSNLQPGMTVTSRVAGPETTPISAPALEWMKGNKVFQAMIADARRMAGNRKNLPPEFSKLTDAQIADIIKDPTKSLEGLQFMKATLDNRFKDPSNAASSLAKFDDATLAQVKSAFMSAAETAAPGWKAARQQYGQMSAPVNQANVLGELTSVLEKPTGGERVTPFLNALGRQEDSALGRAGINTRFGGVEDVLTPQQMDAVNLAKGELQRDAALTAQSKAGTEAMNAVIDKFGSHFKLPNMLNQKAAAANQALSFFNRNLNEKTRNALIEGMKSGKSAEELLNILPTSESNKLRAFFAMLKSSTAAASAGRIAGQSQEPQQ